MDFREFDVLLGIDWLTRHGAVIDCSKRRVMFSTPGSVPCELLGRRPGDRIPIVSALQARHLLEKECVGYLATIISHAATTVEVSSIPIVSEFADVFPDELPGLPPEREIEFCIELQPGMAPISRAPYRMAPAEALCGHPWRTPFWWKPKGTYSPTGPQMVQDR